jgi:hypothetical protein
MTKKLHLIYEEATFGSTFPGEHTSIVVSKRDLERFAQLIIKESVEHCFNEGELFFERRLKNKYEQEIWRNINE